MSYTKNTWVDQDVERPKTYEVTNNQDGSITLTDSFGLVQELGTPVNAVNMNHIEDGIDGCAIRKHNLTETFNLGEWVLGGSGDDEGIYKSLIANNVGNALTDRDAWEKVKMGGASGRNVGEIITSTLPLTDAGLHLLDGSLLQYGIYKEFIDYIAELYAQDPTANYFTDETTWQSSVSTYGSCGKFVYDSVNNTVRLPKVSDILQGTTDLTALGNLIASGLPQHTHTRGSMNITGAFNAPNLCDGGGATSGAFAIGGSTSYGTPNCGQDSSQAGFNFDASRSWTGSTSNANYTSTTATTSKVQPQTIKVLYYIVIANSTKTEIQVDIDKIATDLNGKANVDASNFNSTGTTYLSGLGMPSNKYIDLTLGASAATYTAPANGWITLAKISGGAGAGIGIYNGSYGNGVGATNFSYYYQDGLEASVPVKKGDVIQIWYSATGATNQFRFYYAVGSESEAS